MNGTAHTRFVGRRAELDDVAGLIRRSRLITLTGLGGVGKSRLARRVAELHRTGPGTTVVVELDGGLDGGTGADDVHGTVMAALEAELGATIQADLQADLDADLDADLEAGLETSLETGLDAGPRGRPAARRGPAAQAGPGDPKADTTLLVLDTCDEVLDDAVCVATSLLRATDGLTILTTTRRPLGVAGEHIYVVTPLTPADTRELLRARTGLADRPSLGPLCELLDGVPLAVELAAARLRAAIAGGADTDAAIADLTAALADRYDALVPPPGSPRGGPPRHETLRTAMGWSHAQCSPRERLLWARMSVFGDHFDLRAAELVCAGGPLPVSAVLDCVSGLVDRSVLFRDDHYGRVRYRVLPTVRDFGAEWLERLGETDQMRRRYEAYRRRCQGARGHELPEQP
jgi:predicted ATPase